MKIWKLRAKLSIFSLVVLGLLVSACAAASPQPAVNTQPAAPLLATKPQEVTSEPASEPTLPPVQATEAEPTAEPTQAEAEAPTQSANIQGFVIFDKEAALFRAYQMDGSQIFESPAPGIEYANPYQSDIVDGAVYYVTDMDKKLFRSSPAGVEEVDAPINPYFSGFAISPDEKWLAFTKFIGDSKSPRGELWVAQLDGLKAVDPQKVFSYSPEQAGGNPYEAAFNIIAIEWTAEGKLLFERGLTGIGGYILYGGHNSLYTYDPSSGQLTTIVPAEEKHGLCLDSYRLDLDLVTFNCNAEGPVVTLRNLKDGTQRTLPKLDNQGMAGSIQLSPSGEWIAYATAEGNYEDEKGQIVVVPADLSSPPTAIAQVEDNAYPYILGWVDEETILFTRTQYPQMNFWTIRRDGSGAQEIAQGMFVGLLQ